jgi:hypothetical protein
MQSQSVIQLAEVRHNELQLEATRFLIANQARAHRASPVGVVASAGRRFWVAVTNGAACLRVQDRVMTARRNSIPAIRGLGTDAV